MCSECRPARNDCEPSVRRHACAYLHSFIFGINGELQQNLYLLEDHRVVYPSGHNVVVYNTEDKSQYFYSGK